MAKYFGNLIDQSIKANRLVSEQPLLLGSIPTWFSGSSINKTSCIKAIQHMLKCGELTMLAEAYKKLCNLEYICCSIKSGEGLTLIAQLTELDKLLQNSVKLNAFIDNFAVQMINYDEAVCRVNHYLTWLRKDMSMLITNSCQAIISSGSSQPLVSKVRTDALSMIYHTASNNGIKFDNLNAIVEECSVDYIHLILV